MFKLRAINQINNDLDFIKNEKEITELELLKAWLELFSDDDSFDKILFETTKNNATYELRPLLFKYLERLQDNEEQDYN